MTTKTARAFLISMMLAMCFSCNKEDIPPVKTFDVSSVEGKIDRIVLISIDTLRADHLGCYGYPRETSPFLDRLAREGVLFSKSFAATASTIPSHASMLTSLYPLQHGVTENGFKLHDDIQTLTEFLAENGFKTSGFSSTAQFQVSNLHQGFQRFDIPPPDLRNNANKSRPDRLTVDEVLKWAESESTDSKSFLFLHLFDVHSPNDPEEKYLKLFSEESRPERRSFESFLEDRHFLDIEGFDKFYFVRKKLTPEDLTYHGENTLDAIDKYDAEIRNVDDQIKRIYELYERNGLNRNCAWIITSDHGEGLGNHYFIGHGIRIYNEQIRVPLLIHLPHSEIRDASISRIVDHIDLLPTIADLTGCTLGKKQRSSLPGISLLPLIANPDASRGKKISLSQKRTFLKKKQKGAGDEDVSTAEKYAFITDDFIYLYSPIGTEELYNLREDFYQMENLAAEESSICLKYKKTLSDLINRLKREGLKANEMDPEEFQVFKDLGYIR